MMQAILINPFDKTVEEIEYSGDWKDISSLLECDLFTTVYFNETTDSVFVDDEGLYVEDQAFFTFGDCPQPLAGRGLILGCNDDGDSVDCETTLEEAKAMVTFLGNNPVAMPEPSFTVLSFDDDETKELLERFYDA
jgi:hypothetical protein